MEKLTYEQLQSDPVVQAALGNIKEDRVGGKVCLDMDDSAYEDPVDSRYEIDELMNDLVLVEYTDEQNGEVMRDGIYLPVKHTANKAWRTGLVWKVGPDVPDTIKPGTYVRFPSDKGLLSITGKRKRVFLNAERIFCTLRKKD